ncbi:MAG: DUF3572 family protein [Sneathiella sp.]|nr:DUF3572 family protein [Sneathiella sp.]
MNKEFAEITAIKAVAFLAGDENYMSWLMNETGLSITDFSSLNDNLDILAGVLDFLLMHEKILLEFCEAQNIDPTIPAKIRPFFPGSSLEY